VSENKNGNEALINLNCCTVG